MKYDLYTLQIDSTIYDGLNKLESNKKGFVIIVDKNNVVKGTVTDGDIRRSLLSGKELSSPICSCLSLDFTYIYETDYFGDIIELFKNSKIDFLPIVDQEMKLSNIVTKKEFHAALLEDIYCDLTFDFSTLDGETVDHEIYNRPWGFYKTVFLSKYVQAKVIYVNPEGELSLQKHKKREEHWVVIKGSGLMTIGESKKRVQDGSYIFIPKGCLHRVYNDSSNPLIISEVQLGSYFGEDDIIRYEDKYGRR